MFSNCLVVTLRSLVWHLSCPRFGEGGELEENFVLASHCGNFRRWRAKVHSSVRGVAYNQKHNFDFGASHKHVGLMKEGQCGWLNMWDNKDAICLSEAYLLPHPLCWGSWQEDFEVLQNSSCMSRDVPTSASRRACHSLLGCPRKPFSSALLLGPNLENEGGPTCPKALQNFGKLDQRMPVS